MMYFLRFGDPGEERSGLRVTDAILAAHEDEGRRSQPDGLRVHARLVPVDNVPLLELADTIVDCGWRHPQAAGDLGVCHPCIALQEADDLSIGLVEGTANGREGHVECIDGVTHGRRYIGHTPDYQECSSVITNP